MSQGAKNIKKCGKKERKEKSAVVIQPGGTAEWMLETVQDQSGWNPSDCAGAVWKEACDVSQDGCPGAFNGGGEGDT